MTDLPRGRRSGALWAAVSAAARAAARAAWRAAWCAAWCAAGCQGGAGPERPDVVLVTLDSVRADALDFADTAAAPRLSEIARSGVVFTQAFSGSSWTLPGHAELFSGQPPQVHGVMYDDTALDPAQPTLPELLQRAGYATLGYHTGPYLAGEFGFARGFDVYENAMTLGPELDRLAREARAAGDAAALEDVFAAREVKSHADVSSPNVVARARAALERLPRERPLFLFAHLFDPHYDYVPPAPWDRAFDPGYAGAIDGRNWFSNRAVYDPSKRPPRVIGARDLEHVRALYRGEIGWTDAHVGELLDLVAERRRLEAAAVIVTADHGEEFFEHGNRGHRQSLWDEVLRVPLLVVPPGGRAAGAAPRSDALVQLADVLPTALELAGLDPLPGALGRSLAGAVRGEELADRPLVARLHLIDESGTLGGDGGAPFRYFLLDAWRTRGEKLVRVLSVGQGGALVPREVFWFDLAADPLERAPVVDRADQRLRRAWSAAELEFDRLRVAWQALPHAPGAQRATSAALLFVDDMAALGYAEGAGAESLPSQHLPWGLGPQPAIAVETLDE